VSSTQISADSRNSKFSWVSFSIQHLCSTAWQEDSLAFCPSNHTTFAHRGIHKNVHCSTGTGNSANNVITNRENGFKNYGITVQLKNKESWALKKWYFWTVMLEKTLESPLDCKEVKLVNPKGNQSWIFIGRTDWCWSWSSNTLVTYVKSRLTGKDPDAGKDWRQEEKQTIEDSIVQCHHWLNRPEFEQALGDG